MEPQASLDPSAVQRLERLGGPVFVRRVLAIFLRDGPLRASEAEAALTAGDLAALAYASHSLISTAGNVGAVELQALARNLELDAKAGRRDLLPARVARLRFLMDEATAYCRAEDARRGAAT